MKRYRKNIPESNRNYYADRAYQLGGNQNYYDRIHPIDNPEEAKKMFETIQEEYTNELKKWPESNRNYYADRAYQLGGNQNYYDRIQPIDNPEEAKKMFETIQEEYTNELKKWPESNRNYYADRAYQLGGNQNYYDRIQPIDNPEEAKKMFMIQEEYTNELKRRE